MSITQFAQRLVSVDLDNAAQFFNIFD